MAVKVGVTGSTVKSVTVGNKTQVKKVVVGVPVRTASSATVSIDAVRGVDTSTKSDGAIFVYSNVTNNWEATTLIEKQTINGGNY